MSYVIYYSNYCQNSKNMISRIVKDFENPKNIHWLCIDSRTVEGKTTYVLLSNGNKIIIPDAINRVPAMLCLKDYKISYGADILSTIQNIVKLSSHPSPQNAMVQMVETTRKGQPPVVDKPRNMLSESIEPQAYSLGGTGMFSNNVMSDHYSVWETPDEQMLAQGSAGCMQMHNYVNPHYVDTITQAPETVTRAPRMSESVTVENLQKQRSNEFNNMVGGSK